MATLSIEYAPKQAHVKGYITNLNKTNRRPQIVNFRFKLPNACITHNAKTNLRPSIVPTEVTHKNA